MKLSEYQWSSLSLTLVKGHSDFVVKCLTFGLYTQVSDSGPLGPLVMELFHFENFSLEVVPAQKL